jgi:hypothetical protein
MGHVSAQVLNVDQITQEQNQWCWVGVSKCVLDYYNHPVQQCAIAEYTRSVATWHDFGSVNCCTLPDTNCNYWNYNWGYAGSIQDILIHFGNVQNSGISAALTINQITTEISNCRPFIIRWQWTSGGGHFLVGQGIDTGRVYYMNPWPGIGYSFADYDWMVSSSDHTWTHTNVLSTDPVLAKPYKPKGAVELNTNPGDQTYTTNQVPGATNYLWSISPRNAGSISGGDSSAIVNFADTYVGMVKISVQVQNGCSTGESSDTLSVAVGILLNIASTSKYSKDILLWPNPTNGIVEVSVNNIFENDYQIEVFNTLGNKILSLSKKRTENLFNIDLSNYPSGIYLIHFLSKNMNYLFKITRK